MNQPARQLSRYGWRPADPPRRPVLFINPRSGDGKAARAGLAERARDKGIEAVILAPGQDLAALAREAVAGGADVLGMAGGDGSLAVVAAVAAAHGIPFVCVPAGTRNHFALDVGVDRHDLAGALDAFTGGVERRIDAAEVNGRMFLNNVSLGIYGDAVRSPAYRDAKVRTLLETAAEVMGSSAEAPALDLADDPGREHRHPAVVLVSNNPYALDRPLARGTRPALDSGQLGILVLDAPGWPDGVCAGDRVAVLVCWLSRKGRGFLGLVRGGGLPDLVDQHLQRAGRRDGQQRRDETAGYAAD